MDCSKRNGRNQTVSLSHSVRLVIVVSHKRVEGPELHPSNTQFLGGVPPKATDVRPHKGHAEQAELQHRCRGWTRAKGQLKNNKMICGHIKRFFYFLFYHI